MKSNKLKASILGLLLFLMWVPMLQDNLHVFKGGGLHGSFTQPSDIVFDFKVWFDGSYTTKKEEYLSNAFGLRPDFVRIYNQLKFWFFKTSVNENVTIGKENYLYECNYISEYFGSNFVGKPKIDSTVTLLKELQDTLAARGIFLYTVFAPGKGSFYPEYIPEDAHKPMQANTNYATYIELCKKKGVNFVDFRAWFLAMKDTATYRLYPRCGVHWSIYGDYIAFDSMVHYVEAQTGKDLPDLKLDSVQLDTKPRKRDYDAGDGLNIISRLSRDTLAYPFFSVKWQGKDQMSCLTVGDSYYWEMADTTAPAVFREVDFWYYFQDFWSYHGRTASKENLKNDLCNYKVVCLLYTDASLAGFGNNFIQTATAQFRVDK